MIEQEFRHVIGCLEECGHDVKDSMLLLARNIRDFGEKVDRSQVSKNCFIRILLIFEKQLVASALFL